MTPGQRRFSRRALIIGAGAATAYGLVRLFELDTNRPVPHRPTGSPAPTFAEHGQVVDLTLRWRDLQSRADVPYLAGAWRFGETAGYSFADESGHGHPLYVTGADWNTTESGLSGALHRKGLRGGAVWLDGSRWLETARTADLAGSAGLTVSCRLRPQRLPTGTALLVGHGAGHQLVLDSSGAIGFRLSGRSVPELAVRSKAQTVPLDRWTHICAVADPGTGTLTLHVDGEVVAQVNRQPFPLAGTPEHLVVGTMFTGTFDEITLHPVPLDVEQVRSLYVVGLPQVFTQTSESVDADMRAFGQFKGSDPVPHPEVAGAVLRHHFAGSATTEEGVAPLGGSAGLEFVPGVFGGAWRATNRRLAYPSPLSGDSGTFESWYRPIDDPSDPHRLQRKDFFTAVGKTGMLTVYTLDSRWCFEVRRPGGRVDTRRAPAQTFIAGVLDHVAVTWGAQEDGGNGVVLYVNGVPAGFLATRPGQTTYDLRVGLGGTPAAPAFCLLDDVRICDAALPWGQICPRGQAATGTAGLDLRDRFDRPPGAAPMWWRPGSTGAAWSHREMSWVLPGEVGDDPATRRALFQGTARGRHPIYHPDAFGHASSLEAGIGFPSIVNGWAGVFVQSPAIGTAFSGVTFMLNPALGLLRLARFESGRIVEDKVLPHDFPIRPRATYEVTLTNAGDGIVRGFVDGSNVISMRTDGGWPTDGYAGMLTDGSAAFFSNVHFCALTPANVASRVVRTRVIRYGEGAAVASLHLVPFRWHKRPGLLPWQYTRKAPEPPGGIAGAATVVPPRPIVSAAWRAEDSANSDLITLAGQVWLVLRGNPRVAEKAAPARIGVLYGEVAAFDGIHFSDPNVVAANLTGGTILTAAADRQLNAPSTAYVGDGRLLFLGREYSRDSGSADAYDAVVYSRFDTASRTWEHGVAQPLPWGRAPGADGPLSDAEARRIHGSPEVVALREPDLDTYQAVVFQQSQPEGNAVMTTALLEDVASGVPSLVAGAPPRTSISRPSGRPIYGFRVLFDNGIYYLHYNEGPQVPDWPERFVLAATLDPYAGPWVVSPPTEPDTSAYFRRGSPLHPDNGAIWQGTMFKHRGRYYLYYEWYHSIGDVDVPYEYYNEPQAGSRVGFATA